MQRSIYLDNAATTPMAPEVANAMEKFLNEIKCTMPVGHTNDMNKRQP